MNMPIVTSYEAVFMSTYLDVPPHSVNSCVTFFLYLSFYEQIYRQKLLLILYLRMTPPHPHCHPNLLTLIRKPLTAD